MAAIRGNQLTTTSARLASFGLEDGSGVVVAGEALNGFEGVEEIEHDELDFGRRVVTEYVAALIAFDALETGEDFGAQEGFVRIGVRDGGPTSPMTSDHRVQYNGGGG